MVKGFFPAPGGGDGNIDIIFNLVLADEIVKEPGPQAAVQGYVLGVGLAGNYALYLTLPLRVKLAYYSTSQPHKRESRPLFIWGGSYKQAILPASYSVASSSPTFSAAESGASSAAGASSATGVSSAAGAGVSSVVSSGISSTAGISIGAKPSV